MSEALRSLNGESVFDSEYPTWKTTIDEERRLRRSTRLLDAEEELRQLRKAVAAAQAAVAAVKAGRPEGVDAWLTEFVYHVVVSHGGSKRTTFPSVLAIVLEALGRSTNVRTLVESFRRAHRRRVNGGGQSR
jgi:hypothetical protein